jgi:HEAT repeat protein
MKRPILNTWTKSLVLLSGLALVPLLVCPLSHGEGTAVQESAEPAPGRNQADEDSNRDRPQEKQKERESQEPDQEKAGARKEHDRERADRLYEQGTKALDRRQWEEAARLFGELINQGGGRVEGASYWKAYSLYKQGNRDEALATLDGLAKAFPESRWLNDARQLEVEVRQASGQPVSPENQPDEELKLMALNGLMQANPEKALPLLKQVLESSQPPNIKERALFVLSQNASPKAREILAEYARGKDNPDLQMKSLEFLALFGGNDSRQLLANAYTSTDNKKIKRAILGFLMAGGERERLFAAAKEESDPDLRRQAVEQLGAMGAQKELSKLYADEKNRQVKKGILEAMFVAGNVDNLFKLAREEKDPDLRLKAVELLGPVGSEKAGAGLTSLYGQEQDKGIRKKIIEALFVQGNAKALVAIARTEKDPELKKRAFEQLSVMQSKEGTELFEEILSK